MSFHFFLECRIFTRKKIKQTKCQLFFNRTFLWERETWTILRSICHLLRKPSQSTRSIHFFRNVVWSTFSQNSDSQLFVTVFPHCTPLPLKLLIVMVGAVESSWLLCTVSTGADESPPVWSYLQLSAKRQRAMKRQKLNIEPVDCLDPGSQPANEKHWSS